MTLTGEILLSDAERLCDERDDSLVAFVWEGKGDAHGYAWPDIRIGLMLPLDAEGRLVHGIRLPGGLMDDVKSRMRFEPAQGMMTLNPPAPREDVVMALDAALERFGEPSSISFDG